MRTRRPWPLLRLGASTLLSLVALLCLGSILAALAGSSSTSSARTPIDEYGVLFEKAREAPSIGELRAMAVHADGSFVLTETGGRILSFDPGGHYQGFLGDSAQSLGELSGIVELEDGYAVVDRQKLRVVRLTRDGKVLATVDLSGRGAYGPNGIALDSAGRLLVADTGRNRLLVIDRDASLGADVGKAGDGLGQFKQPYDVRVDDQGRVYVSDLENQRVQVLDPSLKALFTVPLTFRPYGLAVDAAQRIFVPEPGGFVHVFDRDGNGITVLELPTTVRGQAGDIVQVAIASDGLLLGASSHHVAVLRYSAPLSSRSGLPAAARGYLVACALVLGTFAILGAYLAYGQLASRRAAPEPPAASG